MPDQRCNHLAGIAPATVQGMGDDGTDLAKARQGGLDAAHRHEFAVHLDPIKGATGQRIGAEDHGITDQGQCLHGREFGGGQQTGAARVKTCRIGLVQHLPFRSYLKHLDAGFQQIQDAPRGKGGGALAGRQQRAGQLPDESGIHALYRDRREGKPQVTGQAVVLAGSGKPAERRALCDIVDPGEVGQRLDGVLVKPGDCQMRRTMKVRRIICTNRGSRRSHVVTCGPTDLPSPSGAAREAP